MTHSAEVMATINKDKDIQRSREVIADKDRAQRERESRRGARANVIGSGLNAMGRMAGPLMSMAAANDPVLYKQFSKDIEKYAKWANANNPSVPFAKDKANRFKFVSISTGDLLPNGIYVAEFADTVGPQNGPSSKSPINTSISYLSNVISSCTGRTFNWDPGDVGLYFYSVMYPFLALERLKVVLKVAHTFTGDNSYYGDALIAAMGFNPKDMRENKANYIQLLGDLGERANINLILPKDFPLMYRKLHMYCTICQLDPTTTQSPVFVFRPTKWRHINPTNDKLVVDVNVGSTGITYAKFYEYIDNAITDITDATGWKQLVSDLRAAFKPESLYHFDYAYDPKDRFAFVADDYCLSQIRNIYTMPVGTPGSASVDPFGDIVADTSGYLSQVGDVLTATDGQNVGYVFDAPLPLASTQLLATSLKDLLMSFLEHNSLYYDAPDDLTVDQVLEMSRLHPCFEFEEYHQYSDGFASRLRIRSLSTEVITDLSYYGTFINNGLTTRINCSTVTIAAVAGLTPAVSWLGTHPSTTVKHLPNRINVFYQLVGSSLTDVGQITVGRSHAPFEVYYVSQRNLDAICVKSLFTVNAVIINPKADIKGKTR